MLPVELRTRERMPRRSSAERRAVRRRRAVRSGRPRRCHADPPSLIHRRGGWFDDIRPRMRHPPADAALQRASASGAISVLRLARPIHLAGTRTPRAEACRFGIPALGVSESGDSGLGGSGSPNATDRRPGSRRKEGGPAKVVWVERVGLELGEIRSRPEKGTMHQGPGPIKESFAKCRCISSRRPR